MAGSLAPVMNWALRTTLCSAIRSDAEQLQYQLLTGAAVEPFEDVGTHAKSFQSLEGEKVLSCPLHDYLGVLRP